VTPFQDPSDTPAHHLWFAVLVAASGVLAVLAATVDPWLLVMMAGIAVTVFAIYDRTDPGWYAL
jgi:hypothetical protein